MLDYLRLTIYSFRTVQVAIKFWPRDPDVITVDVQRELHNHSSFKHPNVIQFREVFLTQTHLGLAMEPAHGGDLFKRVSSRGLSVRVAHRQSSDSSYCHPTLMPREASLQKRNLMHTHRFALLVAE